MSKTSIFFGGVLSLWLGALLFIDCCAQDLVLFLPGRERWFAVMINGIFLISSGFLVLKLREARGPRLKSVWAIVACFVTILAVTGLWIPLVASLSGPPWQSDLVGMPFSANTPFMDSVWAWGNPILARK